MKAGISIFLFLFSLHFLVAQQNYSFNIERSGDGTKHIILIPGFTCHGEVWTSTLDQLNQSFSCHTLTMAGFAGQQAQETPSLEAWVTEIVRYINNESLEKVTIIGHSLGGLMAQWLAADYPELIEQIIVVDALPSLSALNNPKFEASENPDCSHLKKTFINMDEEQFEQSQKMSLGMMTSDQTKHELLLKWSLSSDRNTLAEIYCQLMNTDLRNKIAHVKCPALILLEANFKIMDSTISEQYKQLKNAELVYANKGMHFIMYDGPEWYLDQVDTFLK